MDAGSDGLSSFLTPVLLLVALYFVLIRPQQRRRREQVRLTAGLAPGDHVVTIGGVHGVVVDTDTSTVDLGVTLDEGDRPDVVIRFERSAVARLVSRAESDATDPGDGAGDDAGTERA